MRYDLETRLLQCKFMWDDRKDDFFLVSENPQDEPPFASRVVDITSNSTYLITDRKIIKPLFQRMLDNGVRVGTEEELEELLKSRNL